MDGWWETTKEFEQFVNLYGSRAGRPWIYSLRNPLILEKWGNSSKEKKLWEGLKNVWTSGTAGMSFRLPVEACDVLIYCSSNKPSVQPAMTWLAQRLGNSGVSTVHWGPDVIECFTGVLPTSSIDASRIRKVLGSALRYQALGDIPMSLWYSATAYAMAQGCPNPFASRFRSSPRQLFLEIANSRQMTRVLRKFLVQSKPKLILTNGEQTPIGCALTAAARLEGIQTVWFFNEWPTHQMIPVLSDEIWVWNKTVLNCLQDIQPSGFPAPHVEIIGMAQLDCLEQQNQEGDIVPTPMPGPRCLVFLSEHIPTYAHHNGPATEKALRWLAEAAEDLQDWFFLIKPRPYHDLTPLPGEHYLEGHKNMVVMRDGVTMGSLLAAPEVQALAALSSSGLLLGAATGRKALRLLVADDPFPMPPLDETVQGVSSPEMLVEALSRSSQQNLIETFPFRGKVLDTMEALIRYRVKKNHVSDESAVLV